MTSAETRRPAMVIAAALGVTMEERPDEGTGTIVGTARSAASIVDDDGRFRSGALLALTDTVGGLAAGVAVLPDRWCVTTNVHLRRVRARGPLPLRVRSSVWRIGRNAVVTSTDARDATGALVATATLANAALVPEGGPPFRERPWKIDVPTGAPMSELLALRDVADGVEVELHERLRNPWGILHGGVIGYLVEEAVRRVASAPRDVVLHFLRPGRIGPVVATARVIAARSDGQIVRVEVRDIGSERVIATATVTTDQSTGA